MNTSAIRPPVVLVVEDDEVNQRLLAEVCRSEGYAVLTASDGEMALEVFGARDVDIVLLDATMPKVDGYTVCRLMRALSNVPVIMVTASPDREARKKAMEAGASGFVSKPFRIYELTRHMRAALAPSLSPSEPPTAVGRAQRRRFAGVLDRLDGAIELRGGLRAMLSQTEQLVCLVLRLENEQEVLQRAGRTARDAVMGYASASLVQLVGEHNLFWADSNELVGLVHAAALEDLIGVVGRVMAEVHTVGVEQVLFRYGAVRLSRGPEVQAQEVLRAARDAVEQACRQGLVGHVEEMPLGEMSL